MVSDCYKKIIHETRENLPNSRKFADALELLSSDNPFALDIQKWIKSKSHSQFKMRLNTEYYSKEIANLDNLEMWEVGLLQYTIFFSGHCKPLTSWELAPASSRKRHSQKVSQLARELAELLKKNPTPNYPSVFQFFEDKHAREIYKLLKKLGYPETYPQKRCDHNAEPVKLLNEGSCYGYNLERSLDIPQYFSPMLKQLADYSERMALQQKRDTRPNIKGSAARVFARFLWDQSYFIFFEKVTYDFIASSVALKYPDLNPPPDSEAIRKWLKKK